MMRYYTNIQKMLCLWKNKKINKTKMGMYGKYIPKEKSINVL